MVCRCSLRRRVFNWFKLGSTARFTCITERPSTTTELQINQYGLELFNNNSSIRLSMINREQFSPFIIRNEISQRGRSDPTNCCSSYQRFGHADETKLGQYKAFVQCLKAIRKFQLMSAIFSAIIHNYKARRGNSTNLERLLKI